MAITERNAKIVLETIFIHRHFFSTCEKNHYSAVEDRCMFDIEIIVHILYVLRTKIGLFDFCVPGMILYCGILPYYVILKNKTCLNIQSVQDIIV